MSCAFKAFERTHLKSYKDPDVSGNIFLFVAPYRTKHAATHIWMLRKLSNVKMPQAQATGLWCCHVTWIRTKELFYIYLWTTLESHDILFVYLPTSLAL